MKKTITSRRRPKLKVIGSPQSHTRHRTAFQIVAIKQVLEVWTLEEFAELAEWERPEWHRYLPGIGVATVRMPESETEVDDIADIEDQLVEAAELERGAL